MSDELCGFENTTTGKPCRNEAVEDDGRCHIHTRDEDAQRGHRKLSHERQERIATAIESGVPLVAACRLNSITYQTHKNWMEQGQDEAEGPFNDYFERLTRALGHDQKDKTATLWEAAKRQGDTKTMLTILKQRYPETWGDSDIGEAMSNITIHTEPPEDDHERQRH